VLKRVKSLEEAENLRIIRNSCKDFMTRDVSFISIEQQQKWFSNLSSNIDVYILYEIELGVIVTPIGYGLIKKETNQYLISGGLIPKSRDKGYGKILFEYLLKHVKPDLPIMLEVLKTNIKAFSIYNKLGFIVTNDDGYIITMKYNRENI
jgi:ribosomal protein S18 acetylase RimI-like enzyme